jgi:Phenylalanyl-tRNA synthetase alpha subunit
MLDEIKILQNQIEQAFALVRDIDTLEKFRLEYLVKKGKIQLLFDRLKDIPKEEKPLVGKELNILRKNTEEKFNELKAKFESQSKTQPNIDLSLPGRIMPLGSSHPVYQTMGRMIEYLSKWICSCRGTRYRR